MRRKLCGVGILATVPVEYILLCSRAFFREMGHIEFCVCVCVRAFAFSRMRLSRLRERDMDAFVDRLVPLGLQTPLESLH